MYCGGEPEHHIRKVTSCIYFNCAENGRYLDSIPIHVFGIQKILFTSNSLITSFHNAFASLFNKTECLLAVRMTSNQLLCGLFPFPLYILVLLTGFFQRIMNSCCLYVLCMRILYRIYAYGICHMRIRV